MKSTLIFMVVLAAAASLFSILIFMVVLAAAASLFSIGASAQPTDAPLVYSQKQAVTTVAAHSVDVKTNQHAGYALYSAYDGAYDTCDMAKGKGKGKGGGGKKCIEPMQPTGMSAIDGIDTQELHAAKRKAVKKTIA